VVVEFDDRPFVVTNEAMLNRPNAPIEYDTPATVTWIGDDTLNRVLDSMLVMRYDIFTPVESATYRYALTAASVVNRVPTPVTVSSPAVADTVPVKLLNVVVFPAHRYKMDDACPAVGVTMSFPSIATITSPWYATNGYTIPNAPLFAMFNVDDVVAEVFAVPGV